MYGGLTPFVRRAGKFLTTTMNILAAKPTDLHRAKHRYNTLVALVLGLGALIVSLSPAPSFAAGGLLSSASHPARTAHARALLIEREDGSTTALLDLTFDAQPDTDLLWLIPVPRQPTIEPGSRLILDRLSQTTSPQHILQSRIDGVCAQEPDAFAQEGALVSFPNSPETAQSPHPPATLQGLYDHALLEPQRTEDWANSHGLNLTLETRKLLREARRAGLQILTLRANNPNDLRPVMLTWRDRGPWLPLALTAATSPEPIPVHIWLAGSSEASATNAPKLVLNDAHIDWFHPTQSYPQTLAKALEEAGGEGFVTEFSGPSHTAARAIFPPGEQSIWNSLRETNWQGNEGRLLVEARYAYETWDGFQDALEIALPATQASTASKPCSDCGLDPRFEPYFDASTGDIEDFDPQTFLNTLEDLVIGPVKKAQQLVAQRPWLTRLTTSVSTQKTPADPSFDFQTGSDETSGVSVAVRTISCDAFTSERDAPWMLRLPSGFTLQGKGEQWPTDMRALPALRTLYRPRTLGRQEPIVDNTAQIRQALPQGRTDTTPPPAQTAQGDCSCASLSANHPCWPGAFGIGILWFLLSFGDRKRQRD